MSSLLRSFYHNLKEPIIIYDTIQGTFYQNKACQNVFNIKTNSNDIKNLKKIGYKFHFDFCILDGDITKTPFDEAVESKLSYVTYGMYQKTENKFLYFVIKAFSIKKYRIIYFYDCTKDLECEKIFEENEKLKIQNQEFSNINSKAQNQAVKMALLNRILTSLSKTLDITTLIKTTLKELSIIFGANKLYYAKKINENEFEVEFNYPENKKPNDKILYFGNKILDTIQNNQPNIMMSLKDHDKSKTPMKTSLNRIIMPIYKRGELFSVIVIFTSKKNITEEERELLVSISMQVSNAILSASLFMEVNKQKEELQKTLNELKETQLQLINSEKMASLGQLIASVAHEINTPLASISANNEILYKLTNSIKENIDSDLFETFEGINGIDKEAIKRITNLVHSLKRFVRLDETVKQSADINKELDLTLEILRHKTKKGVQIVKEYGEIEEIDCYPNMLNQVFLNILMNAIQSIEKEKAENPEKIGKIIISTNKKDNFLEIKITDNGFGIKENDKKKIFLAGFTTKKVGEGTGLGLAICKKIIEKHEGKITFTSKQLKNGEKATSFIILLPIKIS
ncbi:TPA: GAF domain-containing sensor histidine kinase [Candidatus Galligastranaerophilus intestinigallinarum]|nr:GAF domain-containing sensor histidine kinase [Candidatus Galligastranaerophilus intestinigallinarum]